MKRLRKFLAWLIIISATTAALIYKEQIVTYLLVKIIYPNQFVIQETNKYNNNIDYNYIQNTTDFTPENKQELLNIFYTIINSGWDSFSFTCDLEYENCTEDIQEFLANDYPLSYLNNFVHPYNNYEQIEITVNNYGRVDVNVIKLYSDTEIALIDAEIDRIYNEIITNDMTDSEKIRKIHDYIINNTKYLRETEIDTDGSLLFPLKTNKAYGPAINKVANCGGYTDLMSLFLYKMGIQNYKVSSVEHIWNLVYIDGYWKHLDLTWDDPITDTGIDILTHNFFLITTEELTKKNVAEHDYDTSVFIEAK